MTDLFSTSNLVFKLVVDVPTPHPNREPQMSWQDNIITDPNTIKTILEDAKTIAILGIKPESRASAPAHYVPKYLQEQGYGIIPVPTYYPEVTEILAQPVQRDMTQIDVQVDILDVFRRAEDIPGHLDDIVALNPRVVWFQLGIEHIPSAQHLAERGIKVVQNRCTLADHRAFRIEPK